MMADSDTSRGRYAICLLAIACQFVTVIITWNLWQVRDFPVALPVWSGLPSVSFGWAMLGSLVLAGFKPRFGIPVHWIVLVTASLWDQFRLEPQFFGLAVLMLVYFGGVGLRIIRWFLAAMWIWAGIHKLGSPEWMGYVSWQMVDQSGLPADATYRGFAIAAAATEIALGMMALLCPRWAAVPCAVVHVGIAIILSPLMTGMNHSVIPWNLAIAAIGYWVLSHSEPHATAGGPSIATWEKMVVAILLVIPLGFYPGWIDRCFCHVLYSGNLPRGLITSARASIEIDTYPELAVPFPHERRLFLQYYSLTANEGDKLHIADPRSLLPDQYFVMRDSIAQPIDPDAFFAGRIEPVLIEPGQIEPVQIKPGVSAELTEVAGVAIDDHRSLFALSQAGVTMLKKTESSPVYAVAFTPKNFDRRLLKHLQGLPNLEQIQCSGTDIRDRDLAELKSLRQLNGLGLNDTRITERGLKQLDHLTKLRQIESERSAIRRPRVEE